MKRVRRVRPATEQELRDWGNVKELGGGNTLRDAIQIEVTEYEREDPLDSYTVAAPDALRVKLNRPKERKKR